MEILNQSFVESARHHSPLLHIQYRAHHVGQPARPAEKSADSGNLDTIHCRDDTSKKKSLVIIRRPYSHLESAVRAIFDSAEDVTVILDRRQHERRQSVTPPSEDRRKSCTDRRQAAAMFDIILELGS